MTLKVIILQNKLLHYRIPFYSLLGKHVDLKVVHSGCLNTEMPGFKNCIVANYKLGPFNFQYSLSNEIKDADVIIGMFDIRWISIVKTFFICKFLKKRFIWWGLDEGNSKLAFGIKLLLARFSENIIFYNNQSRDKIANITGNKVGYKVANNTFDIGTKLRERDVLNSDRSTLLFVGSFDFRKRIDLLVEGYFNNRDSLKGHKLLLIGDGECYEAIQELIKKLDLNDCIELIGRVNDADKLSKYYKEALVSLSYGQAGLSVLQSLGNGVPFITTYNAISGGEICNIRDGITGYLVDDNVESFYEYVLLVTQNMGIAQKLRVNALNQYNQYASIENMVSAFVEVINE